MRKRFKMIATSVLVLASTLANAANVIVDITGVESPEGQVNVALMDGAEGFPSNRKPLQGQILAAKPSSSRVIFTDIVPGLYAIAAFHDKNGDGKLNRNLLGMPREPYGFSNDARGKFGPPSFEAAAFRVSNRNYLLLIKLY